MGGGRGRKECWEERVNKHRKKGEKERKGGRKGGREGEREEGKREKEASSRGSPTAASASSVGPGTVLAQFYLVSPGDSHLGPLVGSTAVL